MNGEEPLLLIKKIGGENSGKINTTIENAKDDFQKGISQCLVISAMRTDYFNTTDKLIKIAGLLDRNKKQDALSLFDEILNFHIQIIKNNQLENQDTIIQYVKKIFKAKKAIIEAYDPKNGIPKKENDYSIQHNGKNISLIGMGEIIAADILNHIINCKKTISAFVDLSESIDPKIEQSKPLNEKFLYFAEAITKTVREKMGALKIVFVSGYAGRFQRGIKKTIGMGYSDAIGSALSIGMKAHYPSLELQIHKSVPGCLSSDPRIVKEGTKLLKHIDYITAKEITGARGAKAKFLHEQVLRSELLDKKIQIRILNPEIKEKGHQGTLIDEHGDSTKRGIEFIGGKNEIGLSISHDDMAQAGLIYRIGAIFYKYKIPINLFPGTETSVTIVYDEYYSGELTNKVLERLKSMLKIEDQHKRNFIKKDSYTSIHIVGQNIKKETGIMGIMGKTLESKRINIEYSSQCALQRAVIIGVKKSHKNTAIQALHKTLIEE